MTEDEKPRDVPTTPGRTDETTPAPDDESTPGEPAVEAPVPHIEGYEVTGRIGQGGMGVVWRAVQLSTRREVALKLLAAGEFASDKARIRFEREVELASNLEHPNIARIYESGLHRGVTYYAMALIRGVPLDQYVSAHALSSREIVALMRTICEALQHAHQRGVIHRDLKPSNILVTEDGQPHVLDFGLAKMLREEASDVTVSEDGEVSGTPAYMSPEQAAGRVREVDTRSDVYSLGVILFELLTGEPPHDLSGTKYEVLRRIAEEEVRRPREISKVLDREIDALLLKALAHDRESRYASAGEMAQDLANYLNDDPLNARTPTTFYFLRKRLWKRRVPVAVAAGVLLLVATGVAGIAHFAASARRTRRATELMQRFEMTLEMTNFSETALASLDETVSVLRGIASDRADAAETKLNQHFAEAIRARLRRPTLSAEEIKEIGADIERLSQRDAEAVSTLRTALEERLNAWQPICDLKAPFGDLADVFDADAVRVADGVLHARRPEVTYPDTTVLTRVSCRGAVQLEVQFAPTWERSAILGVVLNGVDEKGGYHFNLTGPGKWIVTSDGIDKRQLISFAESRTFDEPGSMEIRRGGKRLCMRRLHGSKLDTGRLRMVARREGDRLTFQVNQLPPLVFQDIFPTGSAAQGTFGVVWDTAAGLERLRASALALSASCSPLERGDNLYAAGRFAEALEYYRAQSVSTTEAAFRQEAIYKEGLCLLGLRRDADAETVFRRLVSEPGEHWPIMAACQLWRLQLKHGHRDEADRIFVYLTVRHPYGKLATVIPADVYGEITYAYRYRAHGTGLLQHDPDRVRRLELALDVQKFLDVSPQERFDTHWSLVRALRIAGREDQALALCRKLTDPSSGFAYGNRVRTCMEGTWILCVSGRHREALDAVNRMMLEKPEYRAFLTLSLLTTRARIHAAMGNHAEAEADLDRFFREAPVGKFSLETTLSAYLLRGLCRERRGDLAGARKAWAEGVARTRESMARARQAPVSGTDAQYGQDIVRFTILGSLTNDFTKADVDAILKTTFFQGGEDLPASVRSMMPESFAKVFRDMWRTPRGREYVRRTVQYESTFREFVRLPGILFFIEFIRLNVFDGKLSAEHDALLLKLAEDLAASYMAGKLSKMQVAQAALAWNGTTNFLGWAGMKHALSPSLRGPTAYVFGHRYLGLGRREDAVMFFTTAVADAPAGSVLRRLASDALKNLSRTP